MEDTTCLPETLACVDRALENVQLTDRPFPHFVVPRLFDEGTTSRVLDWLERSASWIVEARSFYIRHGLKRIQSNLSGGPLDVIRAPQVFDVMCGHLERIFGTRLSRRRYDFTVNRMLPGHRIGIHNDNPMPGSESHRLIVNLNRGFSDSFGGQLVLSTSESLEGAVQIVPPLHGSSVAMEFSATSWHYIRDIRSGARYSLLYSFCPEHEDAVSPEDEPNTSSVMRSARSLDRSAIEVLIGELRAIMAEFIPRGLIDLPTYSKETCSTLLNWGSDADTCKAGLFYKVFEASIYPYSFAKLLCIRRVRDLIGDRAMFLIEAVNELDLRSLASSAGGGTELFEAGARASMRSTDVRAVVVLLWASIFTGVRHALHPRMDDSEMRLFYQHSADWLPPEVQSQIVDMMPQLCEVHQ